MKVFKGTVEKYKNGIKASEITHFVTTRFQARWTVFIK